MNFMIPGDIEGRDFLVGVNEIIFIRDLEAV